MTIIRLVVCSAIFLINTSGYVFAATDLSLKESTLVRKAIPYAKLSAGIYKDKSKEGEECESIEEWMCIDHTRAPMLVIKGEVATDLGQEVELQPDYSKLNPKISEIAQGTISLYEFEEAQPKSFQLREPEKVYETIEDPIGFHAATYKSGNTIAIVFEGTTFYSLDDWIANISHVLTEPKQYKKAADYTTEIIDKYGYDENNKPLRIVVTGHSLGGSLAQYVALKFGLEAYLFNSAGIWKGTSDQIDTTKAADACLVGFIGVGVYHGKKVGFSDAVDKLGIQFASYIGKEVEVPVDLSLYQVIMRGMNKAVGQAFISKTIHNMDNLRDSLIELEPIGHGQITAKETNCKEIIAETQHSDEIPGAIISHGVRLASALIIDSSGSMIGLKSGFLGAAVSSVNDSDKKKLEKAKEAAKAFILSREENDMVSLSVFSDSANTIQVVSAVNTLKPQIDGILGRINASGATNIGAGLEQGFMQLSNTDDKYTKMAVLLSDGENNRGEWQTKAEKYKEKGWPVCTVGFGSDADEMTLQAIAVDTGCIYEFSDISNIVNTFQGINAYASGESTILLTNDAVSPNGSISYPFYVTAMAKMLKIYTSWQGSMLNTVLTSPDGMKIDKHYVVQGVGRYEEGATFQMFELEDPTQGKWTIEADWAIPPLEAERVNFMVTEKTDTFVRIHGFRPQYSIGEPVTIRVDAQELLGTTRKIPLGNPEISIQIQKPGQQMIRMVLAQNSNWSMYKDVVLDVTREVALFDDGRHGDHKAGDGIFGGVFTETDKNGAYLVTVKINGKKRNGEIVEKTLIGTFQVGSIINNQVTNSQTLQYMEKAKSHIDNSSPYSEEITQQPLNEIDKLQTDPMKSIEQLLN